MAYRHKKPRIFTIGKFFSEPPDEDCDHWLNCFYDPCSKQTRRFAARPENDSERPPIKGMTQESRDLAHLSLAAFARDNAAAVMKREGDITPANLSSEFATAQPNEKDLPQLGAAAEAKRVKGSLAQQDLSLAQVLLFYRAAQKKVRKKGAADDESERQRKKRRRREADNDKRLKNVLRMVVEILGDPTCREMTPRMQDHFVEKCRERGLADTSILTFLKIIWAAMRYMARKEYLVEGAIPARTPANLWEPPANLGARQDKLSDDEIVAMFVAAGSSSEHIWRWLIIQAGTACRPGAPFELIPQNIDFQVGNLDLLEIDWEVPEEAKKAKRRATPQSKKRKATIRCSPTLLAWLRYWVEEDRKTKRPSDDANLLAYNGKEVSSLDFHAKLARKAGVMIPHNVGSYIWRHTIGTWLARHGAPEEQRKYMMGHKLAEGSHGVYLHYEPDYMGGAVRAIEKLFDMVEARRPPGSRSVRPPTMRPQLAIAA